MIVRKISDTEYRAYDEADGALLATAHLTWVVTVDPEDPDSPLDDGCLARDWTLTPDPKQAEEFLYEYTARYLGPRSTS